MRRRLLLCRRRDRFGDGERAELGAQLSGVEEGSGSEPVLRGELDVAVLGPVGQDAEDVAEVLLGVEPVQVGGGDEGQQAGGAGRVVIAADEEPGFSIMQSSP